MVCGVLHLKWVEPIGYAFQDNEDDRTRHGLDEVPMEYSLRLQQTQVYAEWKPSVTRDGAVTQPVNDISPSIELRALIAPFNSLQSGRGSCSVPIMMLYSVWTTPYGLCTRYLVVCPARIY